MKKHCKNARYGWAFLLCLTLAACTQKEKIELSHPSEESIEAYNDEFPWLSRSFDFTLNNLVETNAGETQFWGCFAGSYYEIVTEGSRRFYRLLGGAEYGLCNEVVGVPNEADLDHVNIQLDMDVRYNYPNSDSESTTLCLFRYYDGQISPAWQYGHIWEVYFHYNPKTRTGTVDVTDLNNQMVTVSKTMSSPFNQDITVSFNSHSRNATLKIGGTSFDLGSLPEGPNPFTFEVGNQCYMNLYSLHFYNYFD